MTEGATDTTLGDLVKIRGPLEITYSWWSPAPGHGRGTEIWRIDATGTLQRWDSVLHAGPTPTEGQFVVINDAHDSNQALSCNWTVSPGDRSQVRAECEDGYEYAGSLLAGTLGSLLPVIADTPMKRHGERTVLGRSVPCYSGGRIDAICIDEAGHVLYFAEKQGSSDQTLEATSVVDEVEFFDWPADAATPGPSATAQSSEDLGMPGAFHLHKESS